MLRGRIPACWSPEMGVTAIEKRGPVKDPGIRPMNAMWPIGPEERASFS